VLRHLVNGKLNKQIAFELVSMTTVKAHVSAILQKLNAYSRTQAVILANRVGFGNLGSCRVTKRNAPGLRPGRFV
jgi:DNA-binding NarL/FixJ family response regulator